MKTISTGGVGDFFIVSLKLRQLLKQNEEIDHLHVESNDIVPRLITEAFLIPFGVGIKFDQRLNLELECDPQYINNFKSGKWSDRKSITTSVSGECDLHGNGVGLELPFVDYKKDSYSFKNYDLVIQVSGGARSARKWKFNPLYLGKLLRAKQYSVAFVGSDLTFKDDNDPDNFVGKIDLAQSLAILSRSSEVLACAGLLTYVALSLRKDVIYHQESEQHNLHYIHPSWVQYGLPIKQGSMVEVIGSLRKLGYEI